MGFMLAARPDGHFEFFAQPHQKSLHPATWGTSGADELHRRKKARPDFSGAGLKSKGNLKYLKN
jgi:hypothetical protein